jgi:alpha-ribazole phosphatase
VTRIFLCRHGETSERGRGRCHGRLDLGLSPFGRHQAVQLAETLAAEQLDAVYTSPLRRARETAEPIAVRHGLRPVQVDGLSEIDLGRFEGLTYEEAERRFPDVYRLWMEEPLRVRFPDGEDYEELKRRASEALGEIVARHPDEAVAIVSHAGPIRAVLNPDDPFGIQLGFGSVTTISVTRARVGSQAAQEGSALPGGSA